MFFRPGTRGGWLSKVYPFECIVAFPHTRPPGLLALGPIVVNILCLHIFLAKGAGCFRCLYWLRKLPLDMPPRSDDIVAA